MTSFNVNSKISKGYKKVGIFGGSFDPIHFGHLNLAIEIFEKNDLDEILFCPAYISPAKIDNFPFADSKDRLEMVKIAISDIQNFSICDFEIQNKNISYTIDTIKYLKEKNKDVEYRLIIAQDAFEKFYLWKDYKEISSLAPLIVGCRSNFSGALSSNKDLREEIRKNLIYTKMLEISSTDIRERIKKNLYCSHLIPVKVLDYIYSHHLYSYE